MIGFDLSCQIPIQSETKENLARTVARKRIPAPSLLQAPAACLFFAIGCSIYFLFGWDGVFYFYIRSKFNVGLASFPP